MWDADFFFFPMPVPPPAMCRACWGRLGLSPSLVIDFSLGTDFLNGCREQGGGGLEAPDG